MQPILKPTTTDKPSEKVPVEKPPSESPSKNASKVVSVVASPSGMVGGEEVEITANVTLPHDGGWGWVVVICAFSCLFLLDGTAYTFGSQMDDLSKDLNTPPQYIALINSVAVALYLFAGPAASAFINRYGFRACAMTGGTVCSLSMFISYFGSNYSTVLIFYGVICGLGFSFINLAVSLVVGFYFHKRRAIAMAIASCGSSCGVMTLSKAYSYIVDLGGWRTLAIFNAGSFGLIYFVAMAFRPLVSLTVTVTTDDGGGKQPVTYLPSVAAVQSRLRGISKTSRIAQEEHGPSTTERMLNAISNKHFPTAADIANADAVNIDATKPGTSTPGVSKVTLTIKNPPGGFSVAQLKQAAKSQTQTQAKVNLEINMDEKRVDAKKKGVLARLFKWESHVKESRPFYRDDAFYTGKLEKLQEYQKSRTDTGDKDDAGLEYQLAVTRAATTDDIEDSRGVCTTAARRVLATMMDPKLLKRNSYKCICASGIFMYLGYLVPFVFMKTKNEEAGLPHEHCSLFVSVIGFANLCGRIMLGLLVSKLDPPTILCLSYTMSGIVTILSTLSENLYYQYGYCCCFGFSLSSIATVRSLAFVQLYGLDNLTNATGMLLLFQGMGSIASTPLAGILKTKFGYNVSFIVAGSFMATSGLLLFPVKMLSKRENKKINI